MALAGSRALAASTLAAEAGVAPSTASGHLARLVDAGLLCVAVSGRHRYYRLARLEVAQVLEALAALAPARPVRSLAVATHGGASVAVFDVLVEEHLLLVEPRQEGTSDPVLGAGRALRLTLTDTGAERLWRLGVAVEPPARRPQLAYCVDWSEQRPHLAGWLGGALLDGFVTLGWSCASHGGSSPSPTSDEPASPSTSVSPPATEPPPAR